MKLKKTVNMSKDQVTVLPEGAQVIWTSSFHRVAKLCGFSNKPSPQKKTAQELWICTYTKSIFTFNKAKTQLSGKNVNLKGYYIINKGMKKLKQESNRAEI